MPPRFLVQGGRPLAGTVTPAGNKNAALPAIAAALLGDGPVELSNMPRIVDVETMLALVADLGGAVEWTSAHTVRIDGRSVRPKPLDPTLCARIRASILFAGPLLARFGEVTLAPPGGDVIGRRRIDTHILALEQLGATIELGERFHLSAPALRGAEIFLDEPSVTGTENALMAAVTRSRLEIEDARPDDLRSTLLGFERLGVRGRYQGTRLIIDAEQELRVRPDLGNHVPKLEDGPWPAFPADAMSIAVVTATQCEGMVLLFEKMFESRLFFVDKLIGLGARIVLCDPHRAVISGPSQLRGGTVESPDIRAGMAILLAALAAEGTSTIHNIGQIDRGYERIDERLRALGAEIQRLD